MIQLLRKVYEIKLLKQVKSGKIPTHVAIIMDGNRRYAKSRGLDPLMGHVFGSKKAEEVLEWCWELGIKMLTLYAFSTENFSRPEEEKRSIFSIFERELNRLVNDRRTYERGVRVKVIGKIELLPENLRKLIEEVEKRTKKNSKHFLNIAMAYGGRQEIIDAAKKILKGVKEGKIKVEDIDEKLVEKHLYSDGEYVKVDLLIRTGGEQRLSNFLPWQSVKSTAFFCDVYWPDFRKIDLLRAIRAWQMRVLGC